jgi:hypothetical protein
VPSDEPDSLDSVARLADDGHMRKETSSAKQLTQYGIVVCEDDPRRCR